MSLEPAGLESAADSAAPKPRAKRRTTRRRVLIGAASGTGLLVVGAAIALNLRRPRLAQVIQERGTGEQTSPAPQVWFELTGNAITLFVPKVEMGQGVHTAYAQIALEELALAPDQLAVRQANTARGFDGGTLFTFGSSSVSAMFTPLRTAAATVQQMLTREAAAQLGVPQDQLVAADGRFTVSGTDRSRAFTEVVAAKSGPWEAPAEPPELKPSSAFTRIGRDLTRVDMRDKLTGTAVYGYDARVDGMRYGAVARPPRFGATLRAGRGPSTADVVTVIDVQAGFAGVVAATRTKARAALAALEVEWEGGTTAGSAEVDAMLTADRGAVLRREGNLPRAMSAPGAVLVEASYRTPLAAHGHLEPMAALVAVTPDAPGAAPGSGRIEAWVPTQAPDTVVSALRELLGEEREIVLHPTLLGGSFGRKGSQDTAIDAARLSAAAGVPVHVGWTREEDLQHGIYRPPTHTRLRGTVDPDGRLRGVEQHSASGDIIWSVTSLPEPVRDILGFDPGTLLGQFLPYRLDAYRVVNQREQLPIPSGPWRGLGLLPNTFALESFVDELAAAAGRDPLELRLANLPDTDDGRRLANVLRRAADVAGWGTPLAAGRGRGVACSLDLGTAVAQVVEVSVEQGRAKVHRVVAAVDPGLVVHPAGAALQAQGSIVMGLSSTLLEKLTMRDGAVVESNFDTYPILTMADTPPIEVVFVASDGIPRGMGEPVIGPVAAAVANAVFTATGERLRDLPLRPSNP